MTVELSPKIVTVMTREDIQRSAAQTINDVLKLATGVDVRQRGGFGVQTDISSTAAPSTRLQFSLTE